MNIGFWIEVMLAAALLIAGAIAGTINYFSFAKARLQYELAGIVALAGATLCAAAFLDGRANAALASCSCAFLITAALAPELTSFAEKRWPEIFGGVGLYLIVWATLYGQAAAIPIWLCIIVGIAGAVIVTPALLIGYREMKQVMAGIAGMPSDEPLSPEVSASLAEAIENDEAVSETSPETPAKRILD